MWTKLMVLALGGALIGCGQAPESQLPATVPAAVDLPAAPATRPAGGEVMAYVNGKPIYMSQLHEFLVRGYGRQVAQELIAYELVRQEAVRCKVTVSDADVQAEHDETLKRMFGQVEQAEQREGLLEQFLARNKISRRQWDTTMRRNALLRKLAEGRAVVTEAELRDEFARQYGRKVVVRHIQSPSLHEAQEILKALAGGADFATLARQRSVNPSSRNGGLLPPITDKTQAVAPAIRQAAMAMKKKGELSEPIQVVTAFHVLKLERIIEPENVKFDEVKDKLSALVRARQVRFIRQQILQDLIIQAERKSGIVYVNPILKAQEGSPR